MNEVTERAPSVSSTIAIRSVDPVMGAEVIGADLSQPLRDADFQRYREALHKYKVLVFRDQHLTKEQFIVFSERWGPLGEHIMPGAASKDHQEISVLSNADENGKPNGRHPDPTAKRWHTDRSYMPKPALATILYGVEVPSVGGDTLYANATMAYEALPAEVRDRIDKLNAIHWVGHSRRTGGVALATDYELEKAPPIKHPLARPHPATGRKAIYCGCHAWKIDGLPDDEGRVLLDYLIDFAVQSRFVYRHKWKKNDLVMWDNRCTFHAATDFDTAKELRVMYRTVVEGDGTELATV